MKKAFISILVVCAIFLILITIKNNQSHQNKLPQQYLDSRENYAKAVQVFNEAMDLTTSPNNSGKPFTMPKAQQDKIVSDLKQGITLSQKVNDEFLDYLNPEMKDHYRNEYVKGYQLFLEGIQGDTSNESSPGVQAELEGNKLIGEWDKWWDLNKDQITNKAFPN